MNPPSPELDRLLRKAKELEASDLHLMTGVPPAFRVNGEIILGDQDSLTAEGITAMAHKVMNEEQRSAFEERWELCVSLLHSSADRIRITFYRLDEAPQICIRFCGEHIPPREVLGLPQKVDELARKRNGLILITGPTGAGKTTTLNYMINLINRERRAKIVTIEDPIEYVHSNDRAIVIQQEVSTDVKSFNRALVHVLRQDPDVIVVGEIRDHAAISTALTAAETGHLVLATLHSPNTTSALERIIGVFDGNAQRQIVLQLASTLHGVISQELLPSTDHSRRVLAYELLVGTGAVRRIIRDNELYRLHNAIQLGAKDGMTLMDEVLYDLYCKCEISYDTAVSRAFDPEHFQASPNRPGEPASMAN